MVNGNARQLTHKFKSMAACIIAKPSSPIAVVSLPFSFVKPRQFVTVARCQPGRHHHYLGAGRFAADQDGSGIRQSVSLQHRNEAPLPSTLLYFFRFALVPLVLSMLTIHHLTAPSEDDEKAVAACSKSSEWIVNGMLYCR